MSDNLVSHQKQIEIDLIIISSFLVFQIKRVKNDDKRVDNRLKKEATSTFNAKARTSLSLIKNNKVLFVVYTICNNFFAFR